MTIQSIIVIASLWAFLQNIVTWYKKDLAGWQTTQLRGKELQGFPPGIINVAPSYFRKKIEENIEPKEIPSCLIPCLLVVFYTRQLEILVTSLIIQKAIIYPLFLRFHCTVCHSTRYFLYHTTVNVFCIVLHSLSTKMIQGSKKGKRS